jgi:hypothetical protein
LKISIYFAFQSPLKLNIGNKSLGDILRLSSIKLGKNWNVSFKIDKIYMKDPFN